MISALTKKSLVLWMLGIASTVAGIPYIFAIQRDAIAQAPVSAPTLALLLVVQTAVLLLVAVSIGVRLAQRLDVRLGTTRRGIVYAVTLGMVSAVMIFGGDALFRTMGIIIAVEEDSIAAWKAVLASLYGGVVEELLLRLFLMTLLVALAAKLTRTDRPTESVALMWPIIVIVAIVFGLLHLPATSSLVALTSLVVLRGLALNGIGGVVFGWLYWRHGLAAAVTSHFFADICLHVLLPLL